MVVKVKDYFEKTRHVKNNEKYKNTFYVEKETQDIMIEYYLKKKILQNQPLILTLSIFSKMIIDTMMNFSTYSNILTCYLMIYHNLW